MIPTLKYRFTNEYLDIDLLMKIWDIDLLMNICDTE